jgi:hypothetical protein
MISIFGNVIVPLNRRLREVYIKGNSEAVYAAYRHITGEDTKASWRYCKPLIKMWEGKK